ncbi:hypothetical protein R80B4_02613 [Fibrobacteres bacterium R8-0-B4]
MLVLPATPPPPPGVVPPVVSKFAVTVTALDGMKNLVCELLALASDTPTAVQFLNVWPFGGVPAYINTAAPAA